MVWREQEALSTSAWSWPTSNITVYHPTTLIWSLSRSLSLSHLSRTGSSFLSTFVTTFTIHDPLFPSVLHTRLIFSINHSHHSPSGGASAVKERLRFEVRKSSIQVTRMHFFSSKQVDDLFFSCRLKNTGRQRSFTVKIKQIKRSDMVTFLFSVYTITETKQYAGLGRAEPGRWIFQPVIWPGAPWCSSATA